MKKIMALLILAAVAAMPLAASAADGFLYADVLSAYVSNGQVGNDEAVFQPGLDVSGPLGLTYSFWANMALTDADSAWDPNTSGEWNELDLGLSWTVPYEAPVSLSFGATYYVYPQATGSADGKPKNRGPSVAFSIGRSTPVSTVPPDCSRVRALPSAWMVKGMTSMPKRLRSSFCH